jgi:hypothetical protein
MKCPICGKEGAYIGLRQVECKRRRCVNFKRPPRTGIKARVHWKVNGRKGNSRILDLADAEIRADEGNEDYGDGTHWVEKEKEDGEDISWHFAIQ